MSKQQEEPRRIVIIGGGIAGIATAWGLSRQPGLEILLLEREPQLASHSTAKNASILRTFTGDAPTTHLALETAAFLSDPPPGFTDVPLVNPVGLILISDKLAGAAFDDWRERKPAGSVVALGEDEVRRLAPHYRGVTDNAFLVKNEGHIDNAALIDGMLREVRAAGVEIRTGADVSALGRRDLAGFELQLASGETLGADTVVLATGGWAGSLARPLGSRLEFEARRRHLLVTAPEERIDRHWPILWSEPESFYVRPESGGLMLCACDQDAVDPDHCDALPEVREQIALRSAECLEGFDDARVAHFWAGMRTFSPDDHFVVGDDPDVEGLFWVAALGGHGMSTSVGLARFAAGLIRGTEVNERQRAAFDPARLAGAARS